MEVLKERNNNKKIIIKNYDFKRNKELQLKKKKRNKKTNKPSGFKLAEPVLLVFLAAANSGGPSRALLHSRPAL